MRYLLISAFLFSPVLTHAQNLTSIVYSHEDETSFYRMESIYHPIDFGKVDYPLLQAAIFFVTNLERKKAGLSPFSRLVSLDQVAQGHADDMVKYGFYSHTSKIRIKRTVLDRFHLEGMNPSHYGENICSSYGLQYQVGRKVNPPHPSGKFTYAYTSKPEVIPPHTYISFAQSVVKLWMESPEHRKNILNPHFTHLGCGAKVYREKNSFNMPYFMAVQNFSGD